MSIRSALTSTLGLALLCSAAGAWAADAAQGPPDKPAAQPAGQGTPGQGTPGQGGPAGAGGDGGAKPKAASMVIEEETTSAEKPPPAPVGDEKRAIGEYVRDQMGDIHDCYQKRLEVRRTLQGKLYARFDIGPSGKIIGATADGIEDRELIACVIGVVRKWEFAKPASGGKLRIAFPFRLEPEPAR